MALTPSPASTAVFATNELLESILRHLPLHDIRSCQHVCAQWRAGIVAFLHLQQQLFLAPIPIGEYLTALDETWKPKIVTTPL